MAAASSAHMRVGRPPQLSGDQRRRAVIDAAEEVFIDKGYHTATMNDIAKRAGMSKKTLYQLFTAKAALFEALLDERLAIFSETLPEDEGDLEHILVDFLTRLSEFLLSSRQIALLRLMITEVQQSPDIHEVLQKHRLARDNYALELWIARHSDRLKISDAPAAASMLLGFILGKTHFDVLFNLVPKPSRDEIEADVRRSVRVFLAGAHAMGA